MNENYFSKCRYVLVNGFVYNVLQQLHAISGTLINSSDHFLDTGTTNLKRTSKFMHTKFTFAHTTVTAGNVQFDLHTKL